MFLHKMRAKQQKKRMADWPKPTFGIETLQGPLLNARGETDFVSEKDVVRVDDMTRRIDQGYFGPCILDSMYHNRPTTLETL